MFVIPSSNKKEHSKRNEKRVPGQKKFIRVEVEIADNIDHEAKDPRKQKPCCVVSEKCNVKSSINPVIHRQDVKWSQLLDFPDQPQGVNPKSLELQIPVF